MPDVFVTSFGVIKAGPLFTQALQSVDEAMATRGKRRAAAKEAKADLERCAEILSRVYFAAGKTLKATP